jgi:hypothetical protein
MITDMSLPQWLEDRRDYPDGILTEALSALIHEEWCEWSKNLASDKKEKLSPERLERWQKLWVPFSELSEDMKEQDRKWARKAVAIFFGNYEEILKEK